MIALQIKDVKHFMGRLLGTDFLDSFLLEEAVVSTYNTFTIDGRMNRDFFTREEWEEPSVRPYGFSPWERMRPILFELIRGKKNARQLPHHPPSHASVCAWRPEERRDSADGGAGEGPRPHLPVRKRGADADYRHLVSHLPSGQKRGSALGPGGESLPGPPGSGLRHTVSRLPAAYVSCPEPASCPCTFPVRSAFHAPDAFHASVQYSSARRRSVLTSVSSAFSGKAAVSGI